MPDLAREIELLRAPLARRHASPGAREPDLAPLLASVDWDRFLWLGQHHRALVAWRHALRPAELEQTPPEIRAQLQALAEANHLLVLSRARECCRLQDAFASHGIDALALSGWALAQRHHEQPSPREIETATAYCVRAADRARAETLLAADGYAASDPLRLPRRHRSDVVLLPPFLAGGERGETEAARVWPAAESWTFGRRTFRLLHPRDWLLRLCARGHDHLWQTLHRVLDLAELLRQSAATDWPATWSRAQEFGLERALLVGVGATQRALDGALPEFLAAQLAGRPETAAAIATLADRVRAGVVDPPTDAERREARAAMGFAPRAATSTPAAAAGREELASLGRYAPTPEPLARRMLELAAVDPTDVVYDLGCGDGRLALAAAKHFGARGVGIDIDPRRIAEAEARAATEAPAGNRVRFVCGDLRAASLAEATVVCLYLQDFAYDALRGKLLAELRPGARIVSHRFVFSGWPPEKCTFVRTAPDVVAPIYLWRLGAGEAAALSS